jgi:hypothetical protein
LLLLLWGEERRVGNGRREKLGRAAGKARAWLRGPPEHQLPSSPAHGDHVVAVLYHGRAQARARAWAGRRAGTGELDRLRLAGQKWSARAK